MNERHSALSQGKSVSIPAFESDDEVDGDPWQEKQREMYPSLALTSCGRCSFS